MPAAVGPDDFMIVTFKRRHLSRYARKLQDLGIPNQVSGGTTLNEVSELKLLYLCLQAVAYPDNPVCLVAALRSELFGVSDAALYDFKKAGGTFSYREAVPQGLDEEEAEAFRDAFGRLRQYARWLARLPVPAVLEKMVASLGLMALAGSRPGGDVEAGSLAKAIEILRDAPRQMWTSEQVVERLGELVRLETPYDGISVRPGERPLVRIMNLHKVKGLEAPVVFLADPSGGVDHGVEIHIDRSGNRVLGHMLVLGPKRAYQPPVLAHPAGWERLSQRESTFAKAEALRLRYVAATRAGSALIVTQRLGKGKNRWNPWKDFEPFLGGESELPDPGPQSAPEKRQKPLSPAEVEETREGLASRLQTVMGHTFEVEAAKRYALEAAEGVTPQDAESTRLEEAGLSDLEPPEDGEHGVEWGTVIHVLLRVAMENPGADLQGFARTALPEQGLDASLAEAAVDTVNSVMEAEIWQRALASQRRLTEVPFEILLEREASVPVLVRGSIDLVFKEAGGWVLVDYKTDRFKGGTPKHVLDKYSPQVRLYAESWESMTGEKVKEMGLYFSRANRFEQIP